MGVGAERLLEGVQPLVKLLGRLLWCEAMAARCPFNWELLVESAAFTEYVAAQCRLGRYAPRGRSAVCVWAACRCEERSEDAG